MRRLAGLLAVLIAGAAVIAITQPEPALAKRKKKKPAPGTYHVFRAFDRNGNQVSRLVNTRTGEVFREIVDIPDNDNFVHGWEALTMPADLMIGDVDTYEYHFDVFLTEVSYGYYSDTRDFDDALVDTTTGRTWRYDSETATFVEVEQR